MKIYKKLSQDRDRDDVEMSAIISDINKCQQMLTNLQPRSIT